MTYRNVFATLLSRYRDVIVTISLRYRDVIRTYWYIVTSS
jgi:hypothetical protein